MNVQKGKCSKCVMIFRRHKNKIKIEYSDYYRIGFILLILSFIFIMIKNNIVLSNEYLSLIASFIIGWLFFSFLFFSLGTIIYFYNIIKIIFVKMIKKENKKRG